MMNINEWASVFLNKIKTFYKREDFILTYDKVLNRIVVALCFPPTYVNFLYLLNDFERILSRCQGLSLTDYWTRSQLKIHCNVLWFASKICLRRHLCNIGCISQTYYVELNRVFVNEAKCICIFFDSRAIQLESQRRIKEKNKTFKVVILPIENYMNDHDNFSDYKFNDTPALDALKLKFKRLSENAIVPTRATEGSVG